MPAGCTLAGAGGTGAWVSGFAIQTCPLLGLGAVKRMNLKQYVARSLYQYPNVGSLGPGLEFGRDFV